MTARLNDFNPSVRQKILADLWSALFQEESALGDPEPQVPRTGRERRVPGRAPAIGTLSAPINSAVV